MRSTASLPTMSRKMMAPSRGAAFPDWQPADEKGDAARG